ncbi:MAG: hypothetical protein ORN98_11510, partial [Alphaproteobacteria bacterium]|nr:hypothetical protein [Alphaproteobacteria bacterium]
EDITNANISAYMVSFIVENPITMMTWPDETIIPFANSKLSITPENGTDATSMITDLPSNQTQEV